MANSFTKDATAVLDYQFNWSSWLQAADSISTYSLSAPTGITITTDSADNTSVTLWLSGGDKGKTYPISCVIETVSSRTDKRTVNFHIRER